MPSLSAPHLPALLAAGLNGTIRVWNLKPAQAETLVEAPKMPMYGLALTADGSLLVTAGADGKVRLWRRADK